MYCHSIQTGKVKEARRSWTKQTTLKQKSPRDYKILRLILNRTYKVWRDRLLRGYSTDKCTRVEKETSSIQEENR